MNSLVLLLLPLLPSTLDQAPATLSGDYLEARTCDVWVGACFANAEMNVTGKHATLAWKFQRGTVEGQNIAGLAAVAVVEASDTLGLEQKGPSRTVLFVDANASPAQREALAAAVRQLAGPLAKNLIAIRPAKIKLERECCTGAGCARLVVGDVGAVETQCLHPEEDKVCGHEDNFYPPLIAGVDAKSALVTRHKYSGPGFNKQWEDASRRGAYVGSFSVRP